MLVGVPNCGTVLIAPAGSPPTRNDDTPVSVRTDQTVFALVTFDTANTTLKDRPLPIANSRDACRSSVVSASRRSLLNGSTLTVALPPTVIGTLNCRLYGVPLCERKFAASAISFGRK